MELMDTGHVQTTWCKFVQALSVASGEIRVGGFVNAIAALSPFGILTCQSAGMKTNARRVSSYLGLAENALQARKLWHVSKGCLVKWNEVGVDLQRLNNCSLRGRTILWRLLLLHASPCIIHYPLSIVHHQQSTSHQQPRTNHI